ncbi:MAG: tetracycline resistance MFS efflux pump [Cyanobacteria bacterium PR.023]|nr:tetracycline resistance MFS efflux pump [Cyanobacteria bacterium PR.023]
MSSAKSKTPLLLIFMTVFIDLMGFGLVIPILPTYAQQLHASDFMIGLLIASYSIMQFLFTPFWGRLSDRIGRRPVLLISLAASFAGYLIWGFSTSLIWLFASRIVAGFGNANIAVAQAYITDITTKENRARGMGMVGAAFGLGFVLGPALGCLLVQNGLGFVGFVAAGFSLVDLILTFFLLPEPKERGTFGKDRFGLGIDFYIKNVTSAKLRVSFLIFFISTFAFANMEATLVLLTSKLYNWGPKENGLLFVYIGILIVIVQGGMIRQLTKKYSEKKLITVGSFLVAAGLFLTPVTNSWMVLALAMTLLSIGSGINNPCNQSIISKLAPEETVGGVLGLGQSVSTLGRIFGPIVGCALFEKLGYLSPYIAGGLCMIIVVALSFKLPETEPGPSAAA